MARPDKDSYGSNDNQTSLETMREFAQRIGAPLTVMDGGEHWFHTAEQGSVRPFCTIGRS